MMSSSSYDIISENYVQEGRPIIFNPVVSVMPQTNYTYHILRYSMTAANKEGMAIAPWFKCHILNPLTPFGTSESTLKVRKGDSI